jgi:peptidoglycan/LPS O-acetylase OafA/YrhL
MRETSTHSIPMLLLILALFALAAVIGLTLASKLIRKNPTSKPVALAHGLIAATALALLVVYARQHPQRLLTWAIGLFVIAALGGAVLFANDFRKKPGPVGLIAIHALVAVIAVVIVVMVAVG